MLLPEDEKYHLMGAKDVGIEGQREPAMKIGVARTTNQTGEQLHMEVPVYGDETREQLNTRMKWAYSIIQDRMEDENRAVAWRNEREQTIRYNTEAVKRNTRHLEKSLKDLKKEKLKKGWSAEEFEAKRDEIVKACEDANEVLNAKSQHALEEMEAVKELPYEGPEGVTDLYKGESESVASPQ